MNQNWKQSTGERVGETEMGEKRDGKVIRITFCVRRLKWIRSSGKVCEASELLSLAWVEMETCFTFSQFCNSYEWAVFSPQYKCWSFFLVSSQLGGVNTVVSNNTLVSIKTLFLLHQAWYHSRIIYLFVHCANRSISVFIPFSDFILVGN